MSINSFKPIKNYEDYLINENGEIYSKLSNKLLKPCESKNGYLKINLYKNGKYKHFLIHRLVAQAFLNNPDNLPQVNHKNGVKTDNRVENLEWVSASQNTRHAFDNGLNETCRAASRKNCKYATEARVKHLDDNLKELFDDIFIRKLKQKDIAKKFNFSCQYICDIKSKRTLKTAISEYQKSNLFDIWDNIL